MKLFALLVLYKPECGEPFILKGGYDLSSYSFFQRASVQEFIKFTSKLMASKAAPGTRQSIKETEAMCHCYAREDSLVGICMADEEYPHRVAHTLLAKVLDDFTGQVPRDQWAAAAAGTGEVQGFTGTLDVYLKKYQDPAAVDPLAKMQSEVDETKIILHNTIAAVLDRGEKLDDLAQKSDELSFQSKAFIKTARKTNSCCASWS